MFRRPSPPPEFRGFEPDAVMHRPSNLRALGLVCALLTVAIVGLLFVPAETAQPVAPEPLSAAQPVPSKPDRVRSAAADPTVAEVAALVEAEAAPVTRAQTTLIGAPILNMEQSVSKLLRRPIRATRKVDRMPDVSAVTRSALTSLGLDAPKVERILVQALLSGQTNAYIDALLNAEVQRGALDVPRRLQTESGQIDTGRILMAILDEAGL